MPKRAVFERSRRELSLDVSVGVHILLVVEQSSLESQSRGCAKTPILTVLSLVGMHPCPVRTETTSYHTSTLETGTPLNVLGWARDFAVLEMLSYRINLRAYE